MIETLQAIYLATAAMIVGMIAAVVFGGDPVKGSAFRACGNF